MITTQNADFDVLGRLGRGARATTELATALPASGIDGLVVLKRLRDEVSATSAFDEIAALRAAASPHVVPLLDVVSWQGATTLVLSALAGGSLHDRLAAGALMRGEAVTIAVPLIDAWIALRTATVVHDGIDADAVLFDSDGTAVLGGFGAARAIPTDDVLTREHHDGAVRDDRAMAAVVLSTLHAIEPATSADRELGQWFAARVESYAPLPVAMIAEIRDRVFESADPLPVRLLHLEADHRPGPRAEPIVADPLPLDRRPRTAVSARRSGGSRPAQTAAEVRSDPTDPPAPEPRGGWSTIIGSVRQVRARVWVLGLGSVIAVVAAFFLL